MLDSTLANLLSSIPLAAESWWYAENLSVKWNHLMRDIISHVAGVQSQKHCPLLPRFVLMMFSSNWVAHMNKSVSWPGISRLTFPTNKPIRGWIGLNDWPVNFLCFKIVPDHGHVSIFQPNIPYLSLKKFSSCTLDAEEKENCNRSRVWLYEYLLSAMRLSSISVITRAKCVHTRAHTCTRVHKSQWHTCIQSYTHAPATTHAPVCAHRHINTHRDSMSPSLSYPRIEMKEKKIPHQSSVCSGHLLLQLLPYLHHPSS